MLHPRFALAAMLAIAAPSIASASSVFDKLTGGFDQQVAGISASWVAGTRTLTLVQDPGAGNIGTSSAYLLAHFTFNSNLDGITSADLTLNNGTGILYSNNLYDYSTTLNPTFDFLFQTTSAGPNLVDNVGHPGNALSYFDLHLIFLTDSESVDFPAGVADDDQIVNIQADVYQTAFRGTSVPLPTASLAGSVILASMFARRRRTAK